MPNLEFGISAAITGVTVVFTVLIVLSIVMALLEKVVKKPERASVESARTKSKKPSKPKTKPTKEKLSDKEKIAAITAIEEYKASKALTETELRAALGAIFQHVDSKSKVIQVKKSRDWKMEGRRSSMSNK
uniref:Sodium ion-translocating decarboxylase n=1 Tax=uncultured organism TaxID=155900 RepID=M1Q1P0_9ZZZZ|nr:sodium ion-translocating decarboxylase [uncultured organism]